VKTWFVPNEVLDHAAPAEAEAESVPSSLSWAVRALEEASAREAHRAVREAVHAYARDPSERNALNVEITVAALRRQRTRSRALAHWRGTAGQVARD
jgi:hypothetical protein